MLTCFIFFVPASVKVQYYKLKPAVLKKLHDHEHALVGRSVSNLTTQTADLQMIKLLKVFLCSHSLRKFIKSFFLVIVFVSTSANTSIV